MDSVFTNKFTKVGQRKGNTVTSAPPHRKLLWTSSAPLSGAAIPLLGKASAEIFQHKSHCHSTGQIQLLWPCSQCSRPSTGTLHYSRLLHFFDRRRTGSRFPAFSLFKKKAITGFRWWFGNYEPDLVLHKTQTLFSKNTANPKIPGWQHRRKITTQITHCQKCQA